MCRGRFRRSRVSCPGKSKAPPFRAVFKKRRERMGHPEGQNLRGKVKGPALSQRARKNGAPGKAQLQRQVLKCNVKNRPSFAADCTYSPHSRNEGCGTQRFGRKPHPFAHVAKGWATRLNVTKKGARVFSTRAPFCLQLCYLSSAF